MPPGRGDKAQRDVLPPRNSATQPNHATSRRPPPPPPPAPRPSSTSPSLAFPPHYSHAVLPSSSAPRARRRSRPPTARRWPAGRWRRVTCSGKQPLAATTRRRMEATAAAPAPAAERDPEHHHGCLAVRTSLPRCALGAGSGGSSLPGSSGE